MPYSVGDQVRARRTRARAEHRGDNIGRIYCEEFHHAMWQAYRDDIVVEIPEILTKGDEHCRFSVHFK